jgi:hypothetical protein
MSANLLGILELYSPFEPEDRQLPLPVLLNLHRGTLLRPARALAACIEAADDVRHEAAYLSAMDHNAEEFRFQAILDPRYNRARRTIHIATAHINWPRELTEMSCRFDELPYQTPGREAVFFFDYLTALSLEPSLHAFIELVDPYLYGLSDLLAARYMPQEAL